MRTAQVVKERRLYKQSAKMADAHCHLDLIKDQGIIRESVIHGVQFMMTNGVDTKSNIRCVELADNRHVFALLGIDPEHADATDEEIEFNISMIRQHAHKIVGIGEIGLDYGRVKESVPVERQKEVFGRFLDVAKQLDLPVSIHSRGSISDILDILDSKKMRMVHIHFFEGNAQQAKEVEKKGYMISVPPVQTSKRNKVIKEIAIDNIMAESDAPVVGSSPKDVETSIRIVSAAKGIDFNKAAGLLADNTVKFFNIYAKDALMRF
ncbi:MAG: TatD family hydrolase [Candidatus Micrarchaeota archaeon]|nr:TatD family hydrolase [Candidatus Micrarchaeota archaeon]